VPPLWHFYQNILEIQSPEQLDVTLFDVCHAMPRVAPASLSMGMFWCRPDIWISVDKKNRELAATKGVNRKTGGLSPGFILNVSPSASDPMPADVPGSGHARRLRLTWVRLRRSALGGSRCGMRWFLSRKVGGLITATCGLGGPHYGEEQTAEHARWYVSRSMGRGWFE
jgi:hypothetical protein